jgi:TonB family protein
MSCRKTGFLNAFLVSLAFHAAAGVCAIKWLESGADDKRPIFKRGESSVMVTFMQLPKNESSRSAPEKTPDSANRLEKNEDRTSISTAETDADLLNKGVEVPAASETEIRPRYPFVSRVRGEQGIVTLAATIGPSGSAENIEVVKSSGYSALDRAAVTAVREARFNGGHDAGGRTRLTFRFELRDGK